MPGKPGCLSVRSASVPNFKYASSVCESWCGNQGASPTPGRQCQRVADGNGIPARGAGRRPEANTRADRTGKRIRGGMRGTRVQHNPKSSNCQSALRRSDGHAWKTAGNTPGDPPDAPQGEDKPQGESDIRWKSAEGIVAAGNEPGGEKPRLNEETGETHRDKGPNGGRTERSAECRDK